MRKEKSVELKKICLRCLFLSAFMVFSAYPAYAQESMDLGEIVVTASRMAQHDYKVASDVTVITQEKISASSANTVSEILADQVGVNIYDNGTAKTATVDIRGFGDTANRNVLVLVNDRKINPMDISGPDLTQIPLESVERIEIVRGAGSVLYGDNAVGGVVNIITKEGKGKLSGKVGATYGSYSTLGEDAEVSGDWKGLNYYLYSRYLDEGGYRANSNILSKDYNTRLGYKLSDKLKVVFLTNWNESDYGLPGGLDDTELGAYGRRGTANPKDHVSVKDRNFQLSLMAKPWSVLFKEIPDLDLGRFELDLSYRNRDSYDYFWYTGWGEYSTKRNINQTGINGKYVFDKKLFNRIFNFVTGIDFYDSKNDIKGSVNNTDDITISKEEFGGYLFAEYEALKNVFVNAGTRFQKADYTFDQRGTSADYQTKSPSESVSAVGSKFEYAKGSNIFFNVQQTFRFLATDEWYDTWNGLNTDLKQQTGLQYEVGVKHNFNDKMIVSLTPYWIDLKNEIYLDPSVGLVGVNSNYDKTRRVGFELGEKADVLKFLGMEKFGLLTKIELFINYAYQNAEFNGGVNDGKRIPMVPSHQADAGVDLKFKDTYHAAFIGHYVGSRFAINDTLNATSAVKPYCIWDLKLSYERDPLEVYVAVNNLFNEQYFSLVSKAAQAITKDYFPAPGTNFNFGMKLKF